MLWKSGTNWKARLIQDQHLSKDNYICEKQILWGTQKEEEKKGFTLVSDGSQGLKHAVPLINIPFSQDKKTYIVRFVYKFAIILTMMIVEWREFI